MNLKNGRYQWNMILTLKGTRTTASEFNIYWAFSPKEEWPKGDDKGHES